MARLIDLHEGDPAGRRPLGAGDERAVMPCPRHGGAAQPGRRPGLHCSPGTGSGRAAACRAHSPAARPPPAERAALFRRVDAAAPAPAVGPASAYTTSDTALLRSCSTTSWLGPPRPPPRRERERVPPLRVDLLTRARPRLGPRAHGSCPPQPPPRRRHRRRTTGPPGRPHHAPHAQRLPRPAGPLSDPGFSPKSVANCLELSPGMVLSVHSG